MSTTDDKQPGITIFRGWKDFGKHVWSPFVIKLEARLRFAGVKYAVDVGSPKTAPKGKIPYVECTSLPVAAAAVGPEGKVQLSDSTLIIKALSEWDVTPDINAVLSPAGRAKDMALRALLEDKLYSYHALPYPVRILVGMLVYRSTVATLHGQGTGRYSAEEIAGFRQEIWESVNDLLVESRTKSTSDSAGSQEPFWVFGGEKPTEADATLFGFIVSVLVSTAGPDSQKVVRSFPVVLDYARKIQDKYFPDYESWGL
ncbi:glutathione s-transferase [Seiridium cupressi]